MALKLSLQEAKDLAWKLMAEGNHWGPSVLQVMWEANGKGDDSMLWAGTNFFGGIAGHQEGVCGAVSAIGVYLGFRYRSHSEDKGQVEQAIGESRMKTGEVVRAFKDKFGSIVCIDLVGVDFSDREAARRFFEDGKSENKCPGYVQFVVEKLVELDKY